MVNGFGQFIVQKLIWWTYFVFILVHVSVLYLSALHPQEPVSVP